jgi:hypothetical protein
MNTLLVTISVVSVAFGAAMAWLAFRFWREERLRSEVRTAMLAELARPAGASLDGQGGDLFNTRSAAPAWPRRLAVVAGLLGAVVLGSFGYAALTSGPATRSVASARRPLELLSLDHSRESGLLVVTGLVQNPREGTTRSRVIVTATLLDVAGSPVADGRSALDIATLEPGGESPFAIRVAAPASVARYRVGFRGADERPLAHVDRRDPTLARKEAP